MLTQSQRLLDPAVFHERLFSNGWRAAAGGGVDVLDKASGEILARVGLANGADVGEACARARAASAAWAATPPSERAAILVRAADRWPPRVEEFLAWNIRETGGIRPKAEFEVDIGAGELREAAGLAGHESRASSKQRPKSRASPCASRSASSASSRRGMCRSSWRCGRSLRRSRSATRSC